jgi:hypothetical protein
MRRLLVAAALAAVACDAAAALCTETLAPALQRKLPRDRYPAAHSVAWLDDDNVIIGSRGGIVQYSISKDVAKTLVMNLDVPNGLPAAERLRTDGKTLVAFGTDRSDIAYDLAKQKIVHARRTAAMLVSDMAVRGDEVVVLGFPMKHQGDVGPLWIGKVGAPWDDLKLLRAADPKSVDVLQFAMAPYGGAVLFLSDNTIAAISPAEAGVMRYKPDGTPLPKLGTDLVELLMPKMPDVILRYGQDVMGRYTEIVNKQPLADDLVNTPQGIAIVVRRWDAGKVWWEAWFPNAKSLARRIRLGVEDKRVAGGVLRCDNRGARLACLFGAQTEFNKPDQPYLLVFNWKDVKRDPSCH